MSPVKLSMMPAVPTSVHRDRCLWQRHQGAACKSCLDACPTGALQLAEREVRLNAERCLGCGVCLAICPVECFETASWSERSLVSTLERLQRPAVEIACKWHPDPQLGSEAVPVLQVGVCLGALSPGLWFEIGLQHAVEVRLEYCSSCPLYRSANYTQRALELANSWLESCSHSASLAVKDIISETPTPNQRVVISAERPPLNRRDFLFSFVRSSGPPDQALACLPEGTFAADDGDKTPPYQPAWLRRLAAIFPDSACEASDRDPVAGSVSTLPLEHAASEVTREAALWPTLQVTENCTVCGACARYCPSGALSTRVHDDVFEHRFIPGICVACGLCAEVCPSGALSRDYSTESAPFTKRVMAKRPVDVCRKCGGPALDAVVGLCHWCANEPTMRSLLDGARALFLKSSGC